MPLGGGGGGGAGMRMEMQHMRNRILAALAALAFVSGVAAENRADSAASPDWDAVEGIIRDYLLKNPEVVEQALRLYAATQWKRGGSSSNV